MTDLAWLSEDEQRIYRVFSEMSRRLFNHFDCDLKRDAGIQRTYYEILFVLGEAQEGELRLNQLAERTRSAPSRLTHAVGRLEKEGLIRRLQSEEDRRSWMVALTPMGEEKLRVAAERHALSVRTYLLEALTERQQEELRRISQRVLAAIDASAED